MRRSRLLIGPSVLVLTVGISVASAAAPAARSAAIAAPTPIAPANGATVQSFPTLVWTAVPGASGYQYQVSADAGFAAIILGNGIGLGSATTHGTAAALDRAVPDGTYYWRVRAVDARHQAGPWSRVRRVVKRWSIAPGILGPHRAAVRWPSHPLVLRWSAVPYAVSYIVTVASDPTLSNQVVGSSTQPQTTQGTSFAVPTALGPGHYYWSITPVDAEGNRGRASRVAAFRWVWPTKSSPKLANTNPNPQVFDPQFSWTPVPGAARYQVEVNTAQDFPAGSQWCCTLPAIGTSLSPTQDLGNVTTYYWRVRAVDAQGDAGAWNVGQPFAKAFDPAPPTIPNLTMSDVRGNPLSGAPVTTDTPIVTWSPVPGASRYEVQVAAYDAGNGCDWSSPQSVHTYETASTAWTPLGNPLNARPGPSAWPAPQTEFRSLTASAAAGTYCVRVLARSDDDGKRNQVVSDWTQVGGNGNPAFTLLPQPAPGTTAPGGLVMPAAGYIAPGQGTNTPRTPLFTWARVSGASGYFVVIARDAGFTQVADVGFTNIPAYAPALANDEPLADQTTGYYWAVIPAAKIPVSPGSPLYTYATYSNPPDQDSPQSFTKSSTPPTPRSPVNGAVVSTQPTFTWAPAENARNYTLEVSTSPSFGNPIDDVTTDSTAYTSTSTYPANRLLYWRVRANDWTGQGLNWSATERFRRTLPIPAPARRSPRRGPGIPILRWSAVPGAISYDVQIEEGNGTTQDATVNSTAFTATQRWGVGTIRWRVRASFPAATGVQVTGGFSRLQTYVLTIPAPRGARATRSATHLLISWRPSIGVKQYEVDVSTSSDFGTLADSQRIDGTNWSPNIDLTLTQYRGPLYWRVAAIDAKGDVGTFASGRF